jgi:AcrR family transcriptional regulator
MARKTARRHEQGEVSRRRILEATLGLAAERGYDGTTIALVSAATGLPASSVYWHFKNKDDLLAETLEFSYRRWCASVPAPSPQPAENAADLGVEIRRQLHRAAAAITASPEFWRLGLMLALERRLVEPAARRRFLEVRYETRDGIAGGWRQLLAPAGPVDDETVMRLTRFQLSVMDGCYVGDRAGRVPDLSAVIDLVATGMYAHVLRSRATA